MEYFRQLYFSSELDAARGLRSALGDDHAGIARPAGGREGDHLAAASGEVHHRLRPDHAHRAVHRREGRADEGAPGAHADLRHRARRNIRRVEMRPGPLRLSVENRTERRLLPTVFIADHDLHRHDAAAAAVPDRQAPALQPDVPRHLPHRHARRRPAAEDHQPDLPLHRPARLDRALRAGRGPRRLRPRARAFPGAERDRGGGGGRGGEDDRRRGDGDVPDARPRASRRRSGCATRCAS